MIPRYHNLIIAIGCFLIAGFLFLLMGCTYIPQSTTIQTGQEVSAPAGWQDYCIRHPEDPSCRGAK